jgi:hypothetical protein
MCGLAARCLVGALKQEVFLFEKKKQKTFAPAPSSPDVNFLQLARSQADKSVLFLFQRRRLSFLPLVKRNNPQ